ncbi:MAG: ABC transporter permease [Chloroflexi bacterium]|nr:MAG: ABC transporter permease [Chloroflexota bacterium]
MLPYIAKRILILIPLLFMISIISFTLIELPPGDFLNMYIMQLRASGTTIHEEQITQLRLLYGLDRTLPEQYLLWMKNILFYGNFGNSFQYNRPVADILLARVPLTAAVSIATTIFIWMVAVPIGIYSATHQYSLVDYFWTFISFIGVAVPSFLLALIFIWIAFVTFDISAIGLFSPQFENAPWSFAKVLDLLKHIWVPVVIIGMSGTAGLMRTMRGMMLDELNKQYVITARAKGLSELRLLVKYPVRTAMNPVISTIGWMLPGIVGGEVLVSMVLNIPTIGPVLFTALMNQDMYLAGSIVFVLSVLTVVGTLISDILLVWLDPRIRYEEVAQ